MSSTDSKVTMASQNQVETPKSSVGIFDLPCGYLDPTDGTLHREVQIEEITGRDEDMLGNDKVPSHRKIEHLFRSCISRLGTIHDKARIAAAIPELLSGDRIFLLLAVRRVSLGDEYPYKDVCPKCEKDFYATVDLSNLTVVPMKEPHIRVREARMPSKAACKRWAATGEVPAPEDTNPTGHIVRFRATNGRDETEVATQTKSPEDAVTRLIARRIELFDGAPPNLQLLQALSIPERSYLRDVFFELFDGGIDTLIQSQCPYCHSEFERELEVAQTGFFFPSRVRKTSKATSSF